MAREIDTDEYQLGHLVDQSGGMVDDVVYPTLLNDNEAHRLVNASLDEKGTVKTCLGRTKRFTDAFDAANPCNGIAAYYPDPATSRLVMGAGTKLFKDTPHLLKRWDSETEWGTWSGQGIDKTGGNLKISKSNGIATLGTTTTAAAVGERGWKFTVGADPILVTGLRVYAGQTGNVTARLWRISDSAKLAEVTISGVDGSWAEGAITPVVLLPNTAYAVSIGVPSGSYRQIGKASATYVAGITCDEGRYTGTVGNFPVTADADNIFGIVDLITGVTPVIHTAKTDWDAQTLSDVETASSPGDVKLSKAGTDFSETDTVTADFDGTHNNTTAESNAVILASVADLTGGKTYLADSEDPSQVVSRAFDGMTNTAWLSANIPFPHWCRVDFETEKIIKKLRLKVVDGGSGAQLKDFKLQGSNNATDWTDVYTGQCANSQNWQDFTFANSTGYRYYRVYGINAWATGGLANYMQLWEIEMMSSAETSGTYTHPEQNVSMVGIANSATITFNKTTPANTALTVEVNIFDGVAWSGWTAKNSGDTIIPKGTDLTGYKVQWRANLSTTDPLVTPSLNDVTVSITSVYKSSGTLTSVAIDSRTLGGATVTFTVTTPANTTLTLEYAESDDNVNWTAWAYLVSGNTYGSKQYFKYRASFATTDIAVTPILSEMTIIPKPFALSPSVDVSGAKDTASGKVSYSATFNGSSSATVKTRTSADGTTWGAWAVVDSNGNITSVHSNYIQVLLDLEGDSISNNPVFDNLVVGYDGTPAAVELATGFTAGSQFFFATLLSKLTIFNKLDAPRVWDGTAAVATLAGSPPHAQYVAAHKNYLFAAHTAANPSRLYFSEVLNIESWPALNFIDISPNDGDWITGLLPYDDYLIITKNRSVWVLVGTGISDFEVRRIHAEAGCVAPRSLVRVGEAFAFVAHDGIYLSDLSQPVLISERLKDTWSKLNRRRLNQAAAAFYDHKLRIDLPNGAATTNNLRIIYDSIRKCLQLQEFTAHAACYTKYVEAGQEVLLYGHAHEGQVSHADEGTTDAGAPISFNWETKHFNFGSSAAEKKVRNLYLALVPAQSEVALNVYLVVDGVEIATPLTITVPGLAVPKVTTHKLKPRDVGVRKIRTIGYRIAQATTNGGVKIHELHQEYMVTRIRATS